MANSTSTPALIVAKDDNTVPGQHKLSLQNHRFKQTNKNQKRQNRQSRYDHSNDRELTIIESQLKNGKKVKGSKNQISINHLLDFQSYRDLEEYRSNQQRNRRRRSSSHKRPYSHNKIQLTGMKFINVNFKFVVDGRKDYRIQELDPNVPVDTEDIIRIIAPRGNSCPICLTDEFVAPRMITSCGHIICLKCVLSLLANEVPQAKKRESAAIVEKYRECPLCFSIIRKHELKPVLINNVDERFEVPKVGDEVVMTLMARRVDQILALPKLLSFDNHIRGFPDTKQLELLPYLRIFKGDSQYILEMYEKEKRDITAAYEEEKLIYGDDSSLVVESITYIDKEIELWNTKLLQNVEKQPSHSHATDNNHPTYYFYETGFNAGCTYVLSPLDMKVLKTTYNDYATLPSSLVAQIENIRYEELTTESSMNKYKYLSHLPLGSEIGFLECDWSNSEFISTETWESFKDDLLKRSNTSKRKLRKEERDKKRAMNEEETRTRNFFLHENGEADIEQGSSTLGFGSLSIVDNRELPALSDQHVATESEKEYETTVWGTRIPRNEAVSAQSAIEDDDWEAEEMIRKAKEEMSRQEQAGGSKKKKKKKLVLLSS